MRFITTLFAILCLFQVHGQFYEIEAESNFPDMRLYTPDENHFLRFFGGSGEEPFSWLHFSQMDTFRITSGDMTLGNLRTLMLFQPDGNIGVGETKPTSLFHLKKNSSNTSTHMQFTEDDLDFARIRFNSTDNTTIGQYWDVAVRTFTNPLFSEFKFMYNNGTRVKNIAIFKASGLHLLNSFTDDNIIGMWSDSGTIALSGIFNGDYYIGPTDEIPGAGLRFMTNYTTRGIVDSIGNFGIGTLTPRSLLHIQKNSNIDNPHLEITEEGLDFSRITFNNTDASTINQYYTLAARPHPDPVSSQFNIFYDNGTESANIMEMRASGLTILHSLTDINIHHFETDSGFVARSGIDLGRYRLGTTNNLPDASITLETNSAVRMTIEPDGDVGVNTSTPQAQFDVNGKIKVGDDADMEMDGQIRYNATTDKFQGHADGQWRDFHNLSPDTMVYTVNYSEVSPDQGQSYTIDNPANVFINAGAGTLYGPVHLPQGAQIVDARVYFVDNSPEDVSFGISRTPLSGTGYNTMFSYDSNSYVSGDSDQIEEEIMLDMDSNLIDNTQFAYVVSSTCADWSSEVRFKAVVIRYVMP